MDWQVFVIANIFGWYIKDKNVRRFTDVYIEIARKNGKTALAAAISLYTLIAEGESNAEIILAANSREQAKVCFSAVSKYSKKLDEKQKYIKSFRNDVKYGNSIVKVVASDSSKLDGLNCSTVILDEYHAAKNSNVYDVLKSSQGMRSQPLFIIITTAGFDKYSPCYSIRTTAKEVLEGLKRDDSQFIAIYSLDELDDYKNPKNWVKSNPNLDVTVKSSFISGEVKRADNNISLETGVRTKNLNQWCDTITTWIPEYYILKSSKDIELSLIDKNSTELIVGVDLSSNRDITSVSYMFIKDDRYHFINRYYLPEDSMNSANDKLFYQIQYKLGNIILTSGNVVDYDYILKDILEINNEYYISTISYDNWNSVQFAISATENYLNMESFSQSIGNFNKPTREFERLILQDKIVIDNNEITRWMLRNVNLRYDHNGNVKPDKSRRDKKIDGVISMLMCLGAYLNKPRYAVNII